MSELHEFRHQRGRPSSRVRLRGLGVFRILKLPDRLPSEQNNAGHHDTGHQSEDHESAIWRFLAQVGELVIGQTERLIRGAYQ